MLNVYSHNSLLLLTDLNESFSVSFQFWIHRGAKTVFYSAIKLVSILKRLLVPNCYRHQCSRLKDPKF